MKYFVIYNNKTNKYIALDSSSGGYPVETDLVHAKFWDSAYAPENYRRIMKETTWEIHAVFIHTERIPELSGI